MTSRAQGQGQACFLGCKSSPWAVGEAVAMSWSNKSPLEERGEKIYMTQPILRHLTPEPSLSGKKRHEMQHFSTSPMPTPAGRAQPGDAPRGAAGRVTVW